MLGERVIDTCYGTFNTHDDFQAQLLEVNGYEIDNEMIMRKWVKPGMTVANIGANIGWFARILCNLVGESGEVHVVEPWPDNMRLLRQNLEQYPQAVYHMFAAGLTSELVHMSEHGHNSGEHSLLIDGTGRTETVQQMPMSVVLPSQLDFVITDTQGYDLDCFVSMNPEQRPPVGVVEYWEDGGKARGTTLAETTRFYQEMGYRVESLGDNMNYLISRTTV